MSDIEALTAAAKAKGWPDGLVERAVAVSTPRAWLNGWLQAPASETMLFHIDRSIGVFERLRDGPYRARELTEHDVDAFGDLWAHGPEKVGDWEVTIERGPDPLAQFRLQPGASISVIENDGQLLACTVWASFNTLIEGKPASVHFAQGLRVRSDRRREGLGDLVRRWPTRALQQPTVGQVMYMRIGNANVAGFLEAVKFQGERDRPQKIVGATYLASANAAASDRIRVATETDYPRCAELINRTHAGLDLYRPYDAVSLALALDGGYWGQRQGDLPQTYGRTDFHVLEDAAGGIVACAGLWDRGGDMREVWRNTQTSEERRVEVACALDLGCEAGGEAALAELLRDLTAKARGLGRPTLIADLDHLPDVAAALSDLTRGWSRGRWSGARTRRGCPVSWASASSTSGTGRRRRLHPRRRPGEAGHVRARAEDRAALMVRRAVRTGDDVEVLQVVAGEAEAGDHRQRRGDVAAMRSVRLEDRHAAAARIGDPDRAVGRHLQPVGDAAFAQRRELPPGADRPVRRHVVDPHQPAAGVGVVEARPVRREAEAVGQHDAVGERAHRPVQIDHVKEARLGRVGEDPVAERADIDAAGGVGAEIVEADSPGDGVRLQ
jgi:hypothetical protein